MVCFTETNEVLTIYNLSTIAKISSLRVNPAKQAISLEISIEAIQPYNNKMYQFSHNHNLPSLPETKESSNNKNHEI